MVERIHITDINKLRITKVKSYKIHFTYDNVKYFILDDGDEDAHLSLFKREKVDEKSYNNIHINGLVTCMNVNSLIRDISKKRAHHLTYSCIDKQYFIKKLVQLGFSTGLFEREYKDFQKEANRINEVIKRYQNQLAELGKGWETTSNHGSKTDQLQHELKKKACERIKGAAIGDFCEEFNEAYGTISEEYGGTLTDLFNLPYGTYFYVTNGEYNASIGYDSHGDKTIITDKSEITLTKEHHSAYITLISIE